MALMSLEIEWNNPYGNEMAGTYYWDVYVILFTPACSELMNRSLLSSAELLR